MPGWGFNYHKLTRNYVQWTLAHEQVREYPSEDQSTKEGRDCESQSEPKNPTLKMIKEIKVCEVYLDPSFASLSGDEMMTFYKGKVRERSPWRQHRLSTQAQEQKQRLTFPQRSLKLNLQLSSGLTLAQLFIYCSRSSRLFPALTSSSFSSL